MTLALSFFSTNNYRSMNVRKPQNPYSKTLHTALKRKSQEIMNDDHKTKNVFFHKPVAIIYLNS